MLEHGLEQRLDVLGLDERPAVQSAHARAARSSASEPRTEAPTLTKSSWRVARTSSISQRWMIGSM